MLAYFYKKLIIDFSKITLLLIGILIILSLYQSKNFKLDASSETFLIDGDPDLIYLQEI